MVPMEIRARLLNLVSAPLRSVIRIPAKIVSKVKIRVGVIPPKNASLSIIKTAAMMNHSTV